jgi:hypothetical protein
MVLARKGDLLHSVLAAVLILTAFHTCGHEGFCAAAPPPVRGHHGPAVSLPTPVADEDPACADCAGDDCLCLCRTPGLSSEASPVVAPFMTAGAVIQHGDDCTCHIPYLIDHPPRPA